MSSGNEMTAQRKLYKELREKRDQIDMDKRRKVRIGLIHNRVNPYRVNP